MRKQEEQQQQQQQQQRSVAWELIVLQCFEPARIKIKSI